ncbi:hypothetical protein BDR04DRAFT_1162104 [Suillus decipiens]|nr:hypothetical protein BDR04DRAFT_1162104 [Suillus decipiens]
MNGMRCWLFGGAFAALPPQPQPQAATTLSTFSAPTSTCQHHPLTKPREGWMRIDDELVSDLRAEDLLGSGGVEKDETTRCACLLHRRVEAGEI